MDEILNVQKRKNGDIERIHALIDNYQFTTESLARCFALTEDSVEQVIAGNLSHLSEWECTQMMCKVGFIFESLRDYDLSLSAFLGVLVHEHKMKTETIARFAECGTEAVEQVLNGEMQFVTESEKYRLAIVVMRFRYLLKDRENGI